MKGFLRTGVSAMVLGTLCLPLPALAQSTEELLELIRRQAAEIEAMRARIEALEQQGATAPQDEQAAPAQATGQADISAAKAATDGPVVNWPGGPEFVSADGRFSARLHGRVLADYWAVASNTDGVDYPSGSTLREVRIGMSGKLDGDWGYKVEVDFAGDKVTVKDAYVRYLGFDDWTLTIGNQKPVFSLEHLTGQQHTIFMERALPTLFGFSESLGIGLATAGDNWSLAFTAFGETPGTEVEGDEGYGIAGRATFAPVARQGTVLHLGASGHHKRITDDQTLQIQQRPEVRIFEERLLDTGALPAEIVTAAGVEFLGIWGPFTLQGEYMRNWADYRRLETLSYDGGYLQGSWVLTGESRPYSVASGVANRVLPAAPLGEGGWGALELAARFSTLDLNDGSVAGGSEDNFTLGINWHPTRYTRLMFNWVHFNAKGSHAVLPYGRPDNKGNAFGVRAQVDW